MYRNPFYPNQYIAELNPGPRIDEEITQERVIVIDESGKRLGQMATVDAIQLARSRGFSLLELAPGVGRFGRTSKPSTVTRPLAERASLLKLKEQFGTRMTIPEDTEASFPYEIAPGQWTWIQIKPLNQHIQRILEIPSNYTGETNHPEVKLWDISRKVVDQKKQELLKAQTKKSDELIATSKKVASKIGLDPQLLTSYFEDPLPPATNKKPALIALSVVGRRKLADDHCGPTVCLGRFIGNQRKLGYIGMWWKNHVWAFVDPETQGGRQLNFKTQAPEFDEVVSYDNGPSYVTAEDEAEALAIARRWMPQAKKLAQYFEERSDAESAKLDDLEDELGTIQFNLAQVRIMEAYQAWRRTGKPLRWIKAPFTENYSWANEIVADDGDDVDILFEALSMRLVAFNYSWRGWDLLQDLSESLDPVVIEAILDMEDVGMSVDEIVDNSLILRYGLLTGRLKHIRNTCTSDRWAFETFVDEARKFYGIYTCAGPESRNERWLLVSRGLKGRPLSLYQIQRIVNDRELEYFHGPYARAQLNPRLNAINRIWRPRS
jgi:hypothetical protein